MSDRLMVSRTGSDSVVVKGMVTVVGQEAVERIADEELVVSLKQNCGRFSSFGDACVKHDKMREDLRELRHTASEILEENSSERLMRIVDTVCGKVDDLLVSSKVTLCEGLEEGDLSRELENKVIKSVVRSSQEEFEEKLWDQKGQVCGIHNVNWLEKFNDIANLRTQLDSIVNSLSISEKGSLVSLGSHDSENLHHKAFVDDVAPCSLYEENKALEESNTHVHERYGYQQLKHMPKEELVNYFNIVITKMKRDHESAMHQETEKYFCLKRAFLKERGSPVTHRKHEEFDVLRKKIPEVILKLDDFLFENEKFPALIDDVEDRLGSLLSENRRLKDCLTDTKNEVKILEARVSDAVGKMLQHSLAEKNMLNRISDLKSTVEDLYEKLRCTSEDTDMQLLMMQEIYNVILKTTAISGETNIEDSDIESLIMEGLSGIIVNEAMKDTAGKFSDLHREVQMEKELRTHFERKVLENENKLRVDIEEKERLKQEILGLETTLVQKEKVANDLSISLFKEKEQFEVASRELTHLRQHASQHQTLAAVSNRKLELLGAQLSEALEQIEINKIGMCKLNRELDQSKEEITEARKESDAALALAQEKHDQLLFNEAKEEKMREEMQMTINNIRGLSNLFDDFGCRISGEIDMNNLRLEQATCHLKTLTKTAIALKRTGLLYKERMEGRYADLEMAEAEVDLLGDEVDTLLRLLEKIYIALDHYSPILKHYPGMVEILELVRRELNGESIKIKINGMERINCKYNHYSETTSD